MYRYDQLCNRFIVRRCKYLTFNPLLIILIISTRLVAVILHVLAWPQWLTRTRGPNIAKGSGNQNCRAIQLCSQ